VTVIDIWDSKMNKKYKIRGVLRELNKKLMLLEFERKTAKRKDIIDSILFDKEGELHQLEALLGLDKEY